MICITCDHDCHCGDKCDANPLDGGCGCIVCEHKEEENMIKKIIKWIWIIISWPFKKVIGWMKSALPK